MSQETDESDSYYRPITKGHRSMDNRAAIEEWLDSTEPKEGMPKHSKIMNVKAASAIMQKFIVGLRVAVIRGASHGWKYGTPLPGKKNPIQPLGDADS